jgi:hypothetical protein
MLIKKIKSDRRVDMNNKRRYPISFFFLGVIGNLLRTFYVGGLIFLLWIIGLVSNSIFIKISSGILWIWIIFAVVEQIHIRKTCLSKSENENFNRMLDGIFDENGLYSKKQNKIDREKMLNDIIIKTKDTNNNENN